MISRTPMCEAERLIFHTSRLSGPWLLELLLALRMQS